MAWQALTCAQLSFSAPRNFKQVVHVDLDYNWDDASQFQLEQVLGDGCVSKLSGAQHRSGVAWEEFAASSQCRVNTRASW